MAQRDPAARRYADAVFGIASDSGDAAAFDRWLSDLDDIAQLFEEATVRGFLVSTRVTQSQKEAVLDQALPDVQDSARNLAKLLVRKRRAALADQIGDAFRARLNTQRGIADATVTTAVALTDDARAAVEEAVRRVTNADTVALSEQVDPEIIGGAVVQIGDRIIDGSVRTRLATLRRSLASGAA